MRIGMMLRSLDEKGGIGVYSNNLIRELLSIDRKNQYVLFYRQKSNLGQFSHQSNVTEQVVKAPNKALWDQVAIPYYCWKKKVDVVFHPKFTIPLFARCKAVMVVHGADWFIPHEAQYYNWLDVQYIRAVMPLYIKKCNAVISVSQLTTDNFNHMLKLSPDKIKTVYLGPGRHFKRDEDKTVQCKIQTRYNLPDKFILTLTKQGRGGDRRKNFGRILQAYACYHKLVKTPHKLIVGGKDCHLFRDEYGIPSDGYGQDILFPGWIEQKDLPAIYSMADLYLHPSNVEAFPQPVLEAMTCGTPLIASNVNGVKEIAGDAAFFVSPDNAGEIANAIYRILTDTDLQKSLSAQGLARSKNYSWDKCAQETLAILEHVHGSG